MSSRTTIALAAAIVLGTALTASAATVHQRASYANPATNNAGFGTSSCPPSGGPACGTACLPSGPPCKLEHDGW
ncbi:MAG: hypothetical protein ABSB77_06470 [Xanthobacteraceae bacterium]|jgi:hypothetical protein